MLLVEYRFRRKQSFEESATVDEWYREATSYAAEVRRVWQRLFDSAEDPAGNLSEIQGEMSLLERQMSRHASNGEQLNANEDVIESLDELAEVCRQPSDHRIHMHSTSDFAEFRDDVLEAVEELESALDDR
jgi:hypothetical protein